MLVIENVIEQIKNRRSVRTFDGQMPDKSIIEMLSSYVADIRNPFDIPVEFRFMDAKENGLTCPVVTGTDLYVGGKVKNVPNASVAFGYSFEVFVLLAQSLGLGTVWLGGTMNRTAFEAGMELGDNEMMPCASPIGYTAKKMSMRETMMRKAIKADDRLPFEELFFDGDMNTPLTVEKAEELLVPFEMVRLAPSAVNKQPWRIVIEDEEIQFYLKRSKGFGKEGKLDMQMIDMGIALCHFELAANERGLKTEFMQKAPDVIPEGVEYVASYRIR